MNNKIEFIIICKQLTEKLDMERGRDTQTRQQRYKTQTHMAGHILLFVGDQNVVVIKQTIYTLTNLYLFKRNSILFLYVFVLVNLFVN